MKIFKTTLILLAMCLFSSIETAHSKEVKFIQITDSHFSSGSAEYTQKEVESSNRALKATINDINTIKGVDFVVFTGDNIDSANSDDLKKFLAIANKLNVPYYVVIGNHEVFKSQNLTKKDYMKIVRRHSKNCRPFAPNYIFYKNGFVFFVVDGAKEVIPGPAGYYKKDTLKWLDKNLTKHKNDTVVVFQHFPVVEPYYNRTHMTYNVKDYEDILKKHDNVIAIFSGHFHANGETKKDGIYHVSTPALVEPPHNFKVVEINYKNKNDVQIYTGLRHAE